MSFFDNLAKNLSGGNQKSYSGYSSYSGSYGGGQSKPTRTFQCQFCGRQERTTNGGAPSITSSCPSRGTDYNGMRQKHVWREL